MPQSPLELVLSRLTDHRKVGREWKARCPCHDDKEASLNISTGDNGGALIKCRAGCETPAIVAALGLSMPDLFPPKPEKAAPAPRKQIKALYDYTDDRDDLLYQAVRYEPKGFSQRRPDPDKPGGWIWNLQGVHRVLFHLSRVLTAAKDGGTIYLVEGEKDALALDRLGFVATTNAGGADKWSADYSASLAGAHVVILPDNDDPGRKHCQRAGTDIAKRAASVRVIELSGLPPKGDVSDWLKAGGTADDLRRLTDAAPTWEQWSAARAEQAAKDNAGPIDRSDLPEIETTNRQQRETSDDIYRALLAANDPPQLFVRGGKLVRIGKDEDDRPQPQEAEENVLSHMATRAANFVSTSEKRGKVAVKPPSHAICDMMKRPSFPGLPPLAGVVTSPVVGPDGQLVTTPGYLPGARLFYHEAQSFTLPDTTPTPESVAAAVSLLLDTFLGDFPFVQDGRDDAGNPIASASRANALALLLLPFVRPYIDGPTPLHLIDAPAKGTGKTLMGRMIASVFLPGGPPLSNAPTNRGGSDDEEWRKKLTSSLKVGGPFCFIDNITGTLASPVLDLILTTRQWTDRELGSMSMLFLPVLCTFIGTANNVAVGGDTDRRTVWIRLDANTETPFEGRSFQIPDIEEYVREERPRLLGAVITILRAWIKAGRPKWRGKPIGSFERWSEAIGGILDVAGVVGFLANRKEMFDRLDPERESWHGFFTEWHEQHGSKKVGVAELAAVAASFGLIESTDRSGKTALGSMLRSRIDRIFSGRRLTDAGTANRAAQYKLVSSETTRLDFDNEPNELYEPLQLDTQEYQEKSNYTTIGVGATGSAGSQGSLSDGTANHQPPDFPINGTPEEVASWQQQVKQYSQVGRSATDEDGEELL